MNPSRADQNVVGQRRRQERVQLVAVVEHADRLPQLLLLSIARAPAAKLRLTEGVQAQPSQDGHPRFPRQLAASWVELRRQHQPQGKYGEGADMEAKPQTDTVLDELLIGDKLHGRIRGRLSARLSEP